MSIVIKSIIITAIILSPSHIQNKTPTNEAIKMNKQNIRHLVKFVLKNVGLHSDNAEELIMGTFAVESNLGEYIYQSGHGPARGIGQMEPLTESDIWKRVIPRKKGLSEKIQSLTGVSKCDNFALTSNLAYQIIMTRLKYLSIPEPLPHYADLDGMANYWKRYYNTYGGKGTIEDFVKKYKKYVRG